MKLQSEVTGQGADPIDVAAAPPHDNAVVRPPMPSLGRHLYPKFAVDSGPNE